LVETPMTMKRLRSVLEFLLLVSPAAFGQTEAGTIRGIVCDVSGTSIQGAGVEAKNAQTRIAYSASSAGSGNYAISNLPPGQYTVTVTMHGMKTYTHAYVSVQSEAFVQEDVYLEMDTNPIFGDDPQTPASGALFVVHPQRDFYDQDGEFALTSPVLILNDSGMELSQNLVMVKGKTVWIFVPGYGRYLLSLAPRADLGFKLGGEVGGTTLRFRAGSEGIRVDSSDRIVEGSAIYNLYVLNQPSWLPPKESDRSMALLGSGDGGESLLK
jgi:hypothetical protein